MANNTPGTVRIEIEMNAELAAEMDRFRALYGHTRRAEIELGIRRHMDSPPPVPPPPPAPLPIPPIGEPKRKRGRPKKHPPK